MKKYITLLFASILVLGFEALAQDKAPDEIKTIFKSTRGSGGYAALSNKFTSIQGSFANMPEVYGGWFVGKKLLIGIGGGATTNYIPVPLAESSRPTQRMSYLYGQAGLVNEWVIASNSPIHPVLHVFNGAGFTLQYNRPRWDELDNAPYHEEVDDINWYYVCEPALQVELNLFKWMRLSPGLSYRFAYDNSKRALNKNVSGPSLSLAMKFGKF